MRLRLLDIKIISITNRNFYIVNVSSLKGVITVKSWCSFDELFFSRKKNYCFQVCLKVALKLIKIELVQIYC